jgi:hypothetical protein
MFPELLPPEQLPDPLAVPDEPLAVPDIPLLVPDVLPLAPEALPLEVHEPPTRAVPTGQGGRGELLAPQPTMGAPAKAARTSSPLAWIVGNRRMSPRNVSERIGKANGLPADFYGALLEQRSP